LLDYVRRENVRHELNISLILDKIKNDKENGREKIEKVKAGMFTNSVLRYHTKSKVFQVEPVREGNDPEAGRNASDLTR
jgi:hypothetical protein